MSASRAQINGLSEGKPGLSQQQTGVGRDDPAAPDRWRCALHRRFGDSPLIPRRWCVHLPGEQGEGRCEHPVPAVHRSDPARAAVRHAHDSVRVRVRWHSMIRQPTDMGRLRSSKPRLSERGNGDLVGIDARRQLADLPTLCGCLAEGAPMALMNDEGAFDISGRSYTECGVARHEDRQHPVAEPSENCRGEDRRVFAIPRLRGSSRWDSANTRHGQSCRRRVGSPSIGRTPMPQLLPGTSLYTRGRC